MLTDNKIMEEVLKRVSSYGYAKSYKTGTLEHFLNEIKAEKKMKYSLWVIVHESIYQVRLEKHKDTNSIKEVEKWQSSGMYNGASFFRKEEEINADFVQLFDNE